MTIYQICYAVALILAIISTVVTVPYLLVASVILLAVGGLVAPR